MKTTAPIWMGIAAIAGLVFIIATGVALVLYEFSISAAVFVGVVVSGIAAVALYFGWAPPVDSLKDKQTDVVTPDPVVDPAPAIVPDPAPTPVAEPAPAAVATPDPVAVPPATPVSDVPAKPVFLTAPRDGGPDDLRQIKGVGPKLEATLHGMGIYHFDQIAAWTPAEQAWVDDNLEGFKGRVTRDGWVAQAQTLMVGGRA